MRTYSGSRISDGGPQPVMVSGEFLSPLKDGQFLSPLRSQVLYNHSPDGFQWGYGGSGPAQLALALLLDCSTEELAMRHHQAFKVEFVANWGDEWQITSTEIRAWLVRKETEPK